MELEGFELTAHAVTVVARRGIRAEWLRLALQNPDRTEPDRSDAALTHALARIVDRDDRVLRVVYNASVLPPRIVTAYFDRRQRGKP
ncbi:MAG: DUF4258 domain-containing protein [Betaproteobacteria bacterium]